MDKRSIGDEVTSRVVLVTAPAAARWQPRYAQMAPKRKLRASETIQSDFTAALEALRSPHLLPPDRLPDDLVLRAYGLAGPSKGLGRPAYFNRACPPRWQGDQAPSTTVSPAGGTASTSKTPATEILVLEGDTEPSEDEILLKSASATKKAKGKAKTTAPEEKEKPCSPETCANNPNCLNWLRQEKWEDTREYFCRLSQHSAPL